MLQVESSLNHRADAKPQVWLSHYSLLFQSDVCIACAMSLTLSDSVNDISVWVPCSSQILHYLCCIILGLYLNHAISLDFGVAFCVQSVSNSRSCWPSISLDSFMMKGSDRVCFCPGRKSVAAFQRRLRWNTLWINIVLRSSSWNAAAEAADAAAEAADAVAEAADAAAEGAELNKINACV